MKRFTKLAGAAALLFGTGVATFAQADASATTCGEFAQMDDAGKLLYVHELLLWIGETANFDKAGAALVGRYASNPHDDTTPQTDVEFGKPTGGWTHHEMKIEVESHCNRMPASTNIVQRLREHT